MKKAVSKVMSVASVVALLVGLGVFFTSALNSPHIAAESSVDATNNCNESQNTTRVNLGENPAQPVSLLATATEPQVESIEFEKNIVY